MSSLKFWYFGILFIANPVFGDSSREEKSWIDTNVITKFYMTNLKNQGYFQEISSDSLSNPDGCRKGFNNKARLIVLVHGFSRTREEKWIDKMTRQLTKQPNVHVIAANWRVPNCVFPITVFDNTKLYKCAYQGIGTAADQTAKFLDKLTCHYGPWRDIHILGHSMGAHVAGQIAARLKKNYGITVDRITGLDPALPRFRDRSDLSLHKSHADFVDVIHTNSLPADNSSFGLYRPHGHIDVYPNGGDDQPGCPQTHQHTNNAFGLIANITMYGKPLATWISDTFIGESYPDLISNLVSHRSYLLCNHYYAPEYMTLSIAHKNCKYWAIPMAKKGQSIDCKKGGCVEMGINAKRYRQSGGQYYIDMNNIRPECKPDDVADIYPWPLNSSTPSYQIGLDSLLSSVLNPIVAAFS